MPQEELLISALVYGQYVSYIIIIRSLINLIESVLSAKKFADSTQWWAFNKIK